MTPSRLGSLLLLSFLLASALVLWLPAEAGETLVLKGPLYSSLVASQWKFSLPESVLQKTFLQQGSTGRLKKVLHNLLAGRTVRVGVLGGSITVAKQDPDNGGYFGRTVKWMRKAFPKAKILERNGGIRGSTTMYVEHHLGSRLEPGVDLVFIEYAINALFNTSTMFYEDIASYERILRAVLSGTHAPPGKAKPAAALLINMWRCCRFNGSHYSLLGFHEDTSNHLSILSQYYSVPTMSVRNGLHPAYRLGKGLFSNIFGEFPPSKFHVMIHPNAAGHKFMADILIYAFYTVLAQMEQHGITRGDRELMQEALPPPMVSNDYRQVIGAWNAEAMSDIVIHTSGWESMVESTGAVFETSTPGSTLRLRVDTRVPDPLLQQIQQDLASSAGAGGRPNLSRLQVLVYLGLLQSYEHMGVVRVSCVAGCSCRDAVFDTGKVLRNVSVTTPYPVLVSSSQDCTLELVCEDSTSSGEQKLSLRGVSVVASIAMGSQATVLQYHPSM